MSLSLIQGYSSAEEEEERFTHEDSEEDDENEDANPNRSASLNSLFDLPKSSRDSLLPSALDAFSEIAGPPEFLNNAIAAEQVSAKELDVRARHGGRRARKEKKDLPPDNAPLSFPSLESFTTMRLPPIAKSIPPSDDEGVVVEAKAQLVGIRERVRSDVDGNFSPTSAITQKGSMSSPAGEGKRVASATNPDAKDAAELLRMCLQCGVPKTYSNAQGMVCPICGDRPPADPNKESEKKKGSTIKDKERSKRMKGQSSHSAWKSETEMQLRQQFD